MAQSSNPDVENAAEKDGFHRPRRPNPETLVYLKSLPLDADASSDEEIKAYVASASDDAELPPIMAAALAAIDEIKHEVASLAGDEDGSEILEALIRTAVPYSEQAARILLQGTIGYCAHLATHRYGSHVLQTLLQLAVISRSDKDVATAGDAPPMSASGVPPLATLVLAIHEELLPQATELRAHLCGSHVLRTLVCIMAGVRMKGHGGQAMRRGKQKNTKKKRKRALHAHDGDSDRSTQLELEYELSPRVDVAIMADALNQMTEALSGSEVQAPGLLQQLACHQSAGPLLIILLRALTYKDAPSSWRKKQAKRAEQPASRYGDTSLEPQFELGSSGYKLMERLLCWQSGNADQAWAGDVIYGLAGEARGSHVLEAIFKLSPDSIYKEVMVLGGFDSAETLKEYVEHEVSNFVVQNLLMTIRSEDQATCILRALLPLVSNGYVIDPSHKRRGVLWRAAELACRFNALQSDFEASLRVAFSKKFLEDCVTNLLFVGIDSKHRETFALDAPGAHVVNSLLKFTPDIALRALTGALKMSKDDLESLAKNSLGSRCIWDGIMGRAHGVPDFASACVKLVKKLSGRWVTIASDRVGQHVVMNLFQCLPAMDDRKRLVEELSVGRSRLNGCAMGRNVIAACFVREFSMDGEESWSALVKKMLRNTAWVEGLQESGSRDESKSVPRTKRIYKDNFEEPRKSKATKHTKDSVATIMDVIKLPTDKGAPRRDSYHDAE
ncbi:hypothetical protein MPSEU_000217100 [Mayamaea pseudoterrestris]|nr:hypothetical protein MPSEU_000217100 [Mayamaea pseudoterrestris]